MIVTKVCITGMTPQEPNAKIDPQFIVIDEWAGMSISLLYISPSNYLAVISAFLLFRFFDITKLGPVGWAENLPGAWGIMLDDVVAGIFATLLLHLILIIV